MAPRPGRHGGAGTRNDTLTRHGCRPACVLPPQGFDEYMNLVLDAAEEVDMKKGGRKALGRILLKGDNITLMMAAAGAEKK